MDKCNFIGANATSKSLRKIGEYFGDEKLKERIEKVIAEEEAKVKVALDAIKPKKQKESFQCYS